MKALYTTGIGNQQTLTNAQDEKIPIYDNITDAQSDLSNLEEGQIIGTKADLSTETIVDEVENGNMKAVTSNAVYDAIQNTVNNMVVYPTEAELEEDLPNLEDDTIVATYGDGNYQNAPLGSIIAYYGLTDPTDKNWLICDGRDTTNTDIELETYYPSLYMFLGESNVLPDLRECALVGVGENTTDNIATNDVYTLGQFKDDQIQNITGSFKDNSFIQGTGYANDVSGAIYNSNVTNGGHSGGGGGSNSFATREFDASLVARTGTTTHGKQKGVNWIIKATSSVDIIHFPSSDIQTIESYIDNGLSNTRMIPICTTESSTQTKEVTIAGFTLLAGVSFRVLFQNECSAENPTLKINNETAKEIKVVQNGSKIVIPRHEGYWRGTSSTSYEVWQPNTILELMYDGTDFIVVGNPIVENYTDTISSYTVFANGYKEQWGKVNSSGDGRTVTYPVKFTSSNFGIVSPNYNSTNATSFQKFAYNIGLTSLNASTGTAEAKWFVNGY